MVQRGKVRCSLVQYVADVLSDVGWLQLVGSLKSYVSVKNIGLFCRALLQKRPVILRSLLVVATPYVMPFVVCCSVS